MFSPLCFRVAAGKIVRGWSWDPSARQPIAVEDVKKPNKQKHIFNDHENYIVMHMLCS